MFNPQSFIEAYSCLEHGSSRLNGIKYAIEQADLAKDYEWSIKFRHEYIQESVFHDDTLKAFVVFPEYITLCDQHPENIDVHNLMWTYKWILEEMSNFYQISLDKIETYFNDYKERCKMYGYGLHSYYMKRISCFEYINTDEVKNCIDKFRKTECDEMSDCAACEKHLEVSYELMHGSFDKAFKLAQPIFSGESRCAEVPHLTYAMFMKYYMEHSEWEKADYYQKLLYKKIYSNSNFLREIGWIIEYFSITNLNKGLRIFKKHISWAENSKNPMMNFYFWNGAYRLFDAIAKQGKETIRVMMPMSFEFYNDDDTYCPKELAEIYIEKAKTIAEKFDERNGTCYFSDIIKKTSPYVGSSENKDINDENKKCLQLLSNVPQKPSYIASVPQNISEINSPDVIIENLDNSELFETLDIDFNNQTQQIIATIKSLDEIYEVKIQLSPMVKLEGYMQKHSLSDEYIEALNNAEICVLTSMEFNEEPLQCYWLQLKILETVVPKSAGIIDYNTRNILSPIWLKTAVYSTVPPTPKYLFSLGTVAKKENPDILWLYTSGLDRCGIREFEVISANEESYPLYTAILETFALRSIDEECFIDEGEPIYIADFENGNPLVCTWLDWKNAVSAYPDDMIGGLNDHKNLNIDYGTIFVYPQRDDYENDNPVILSSLSLEKDGDILVMISADETERMSILARERFSFFLEGIHHIENAKGFIKVRIEINTDCTEEEPQFEHIWTEFIECEDRALTLKLLQTPYYSDNFNIGDILNTSTDELTDWNIRVNNSTLTPDEIYLLFEE